MTAAAHPLAGSRARLRAGLALTALAVVFLAFDTGIQDPPTAVLGAVLFTGYLGGAIATHVRGRSPLLTHILFPVYVAGLVWGGLDLREVRLRALLPLRR